MTHRRIRRLYCLSYMAKGSVPIRELQQNLELAVAKATGLTVIDIKRASARTSRM